MNPDELHPNARLYKYGAPRPETGPATGDLAVIDAVAAHIERHIGAVGDVWHETESSYVHVDVHHVPPTSARPFHVLVTSGMSERPMAGPPGVPDEWLRAELLMCLPADWPLDPAALRGERHGWPLYWLRLIARFAHAYGAFLSGGHTVPNGEPPAPPAPLGPGTELAGVMLVPPVALGQAAHLAQTPDGKTIRFWSLLPLYPSEMEFKLRHGVDALVERLIRANVSDVVDLTRPNVAG
jgi:hypothetical protein